MVSGVAHTGCDFVLGANVRDIGDGSQGEDQKEYGDGGWNLVDALSSGTRGRCREIERLLFSIFAE